MPVPLAFYAPLKSPRHHVPSGDRTVARLLLQALGLAGFAPELASELRTFEPVGDESRQHALRAQGRAEAERLVADYAKRPAALRPRLWFTYHSYYKAPDWTGPAVARALSIPYVVAEPSRASRRAAGPFAVGHAGAEAALAQADVLFVATGHDREALARAVPSGQRLVDLPPFLDTDRWPAPDPVRARPAVPDGEAGPVRLLAAAMMRAGDKLASFRQLAAALARLDGCAPLPGGWRLDVAGDGPERATVERLLAPFGSRVAFHGRLEAPLPLAGLYAAADLLVWPAVNEAYGMALLEAQAMGCPVLVGRHGGVESALLPGRTGLVVPPDDSAAFAQALAALASDRGRLRRMGRQGRRFVHEERSLPGAARRLRAGLAGLAGGSLAA